MTTALASFIATGDRSTNVVVIDNRFDFGEVDVGLRHMVEIVGEDVECHVGNDFGNGTIIQSSATDLCDIGVTHPSAIVDQLAGEANDSIGLRIDGGSATANEDLIGSQPNHLADRRVSRQTVVALVRLPDSQCDLFAVLRRQASLAYSAPLRPR